MNNSLPNYFIKHQKIFTMKSYQQTFLAFLPIVLLALLSLSPIFQSCDNPYARSEAERVKLEAEKDDLIDSHSCEMEEKEQLIADQQEALFNEQYTNSLRQDSIEGLKKKNYINYIGRKKAENANKKLVSKNDSLQERSDILEEAIAEHKKELAEYIALDNSNSTIIAAKEEKISQLEQEFDTVLQLIEESLPTTTNNKGESYAVADDGASRYDKAENYVRNARINQLNEFAKELQASLFPIAKDANGNTVNKRNAIKFRDRWRSLDVTASISHPNESKLNDANYLNELVAIVRNHHNGLSGFHPITETRTQQDQLTLPYTDNTLRFDYYLDKQISGSFFTIALYYKNPLSHQLVFLAEQTIFKEKNTPTPPPTRESYLVTEKSNEP